MKLMMAKRLPLALSLVFMLLSTAIWAQSPPATASGKIGGANIKIDYSSPSVKGRPIWGALVPYDKVWRAGANKATVLETDKDLNVEGKSLAAGKYSLFAIPNEKEWKIIFNSETGQWGSKRGGEANRDPAKDVLTVSVKPLKSTMSESLAYVISDKGFSLKWENIEVPVSVGSGMEKMAAAPAHSDPAQMMIKEWERAKTFTSEYLEAMPEAGYALKPTPDMRSFAEQMMHLTDGNYGFAAAIFGKESPFGQGAHEKAADKSKAAVTKAVLAGYDYIIDGLRNMNSAELGKSVTIFGRFEMSKETALAKCFEHQTHHRGQTTVYIRLAGAKPPQEKLF